MKKWILLCAFTAALAFAAVLAWRLSPDALALIAGVVLGLLALIPTLALALLMLRRTAPAESDRQTQPAQAPVIVVSGGYPAMLPAQGAAGNGQGMIPTPYDRSLPALPYPYATSQPVAGAEAPGRRWDMRVVGERAGRDAQAAGEWLS